MKQEWVRKRLKVSNSSEFNVRGRKYFEFILSSMLDFTFFVTIQFQRSWTILIANFNHLKSLSILDYIK